MEFFESHGCELKTERGNRVFPVTDRSLSVLDCLQNELRRLRVTVRNEPVAEILTEDGRVSGVKTGKNTYESPWVILATGGVSYHMRSGNGATDQIRAKADDHAERLLALLATL